MEYKNDDRLTYAEAVKYIQFLGGKIKDQTTIRYHIKKGLLKPDGYIFPNSKRYPYFYRLTINKAFRRGMGRNNKKTYYRGHEYNEL